MLSVAWWTCALLAVASARVYRQCELARDLLTFGIKREQVATWVCIAYHESRLDTAAYNHGSGDHGLLQISEIYWCGKGKACGVSCPSLRDEDIANDVECALKIHKEHSHLQGDGFMAWVVYPLYCKNNTLSYIAGCDDILKNVTVSKVGKSYNFHAQVKPLEEEPNFLKTNSFLRGTYSNEVRGELYDDDTVSADWTNVIIENIDDLSLPSKNQVHKPVNTIKKQTVTSSTTTQKIPSYLSISSLFQKSLSNNEDSSDINNKKDSSLVKMTEGEKIISTDGISSKSSNNNLPSTTISVDSMPTPAFLSVVSVIQRNLGDEFNNVNENNSFKWLDFKVDNIDGLSFTNKKNVINTDSQRILQTYQDSAPSIELSSFNDNQEEKEKYNLTRISHVDDLILPDNTTLRNTLHKTENQYNRKYDKMPSYLKVASFIQQHLDTNIHDSEIVEYATREKDSDITNTENTSAITGEIKLVTNEINQPMFLNIASKFQQEVERKKSSGHKSSRKHWQHVTETTENAVITTEVTSFAPLPVKPSRIIESNQFRHKTSTPSTTTLENEVTIEPILITTEKQVLIPVKPSYVLETKDFRHKTKTTKNDQVDRKTSITPYSTKISSYRLTSNNTMSPVTETSASLFINKHRSTPSLHQFGYTTPKITTLIDASSENVLNTRENPAYLTTKKLPSWYTFTSRTSKPTTSNVNQEAVSTTTPSPSVSIADANIRNKNITVTPNPWGTRFTHPFHRQPVTESSSTEGKPSTRRPWRTTVPWQSKVNFTIKTEAEEQSKSNDVDKNATIKDNNSFLVNLTDQNKNVSSLSSNYRHSRLWQSRTTPLTVLKSEINTLSSPSQILYSTTRVPWYTLTNRITTTLTNNVTESTTTDKFSSRKSPSTVKSNPSWPWSSQTRGSTLTTTPTPTFSTTNSPITRSWYTFTSRTTSTTKLISPVNSSVNSTSAPKFKSWTPWSWRTSIVPENKTSAEVVSTTVNPFKINSSTLSTTKTSSPSTPFRTSTLSIFDIYYKTYGIASDKTKINESTSNHTSII